MIVQTFMAIFSLCVLAYSLWLARVSWKNFSEADRLRAEQPLAVRVSVNTHCKTCETLTVFDVSDVAAAGHADCPNCGTLLLTATNYRTQA